MRSMNCLFSAALVLALAAGCARNDASKSALARQLSQQSERIAELEDAVRSLQAELAAVRATASTGAIDRLSAQIDRTIAGRVDAVLGAKIASAVQNEVEQKVGSKEDVEQIFDAALQRAVAKVEARDQGRRDSPRALWRQRPQDLRPQTDQQRLDNLAAELKLTDQQKELMKSADATTQKAIQEAVTAMQTEGKTDPRQIHETIQAARTRQDETVKSILTAEQYEAYQKKPRSAVTYWSSSDANGAGGRQIHVVTSSGTASATVNAAGGTDAGPVQIQIMTPDIQIVTPDDAPAVTTVLQ